MMRQDKNPIESPRASLEPKSCLCEAEFQAKQASLKDLRNVQDLKHWSELTPKASEEIVEKPKVNDIDIAVFLERIISLFGRVMRELELAAALPILLEDPETLEALTGAEKKAIETAFTSRESLKSAQSSVQSESPHVTLETEEQSTESSYSTCSSYSLSSKTDEALKILNNYSSIRKKVKSSSRDIAPQCRLFLQHMKYFIEHCVLRIRSTPEQAKSREDNFRKLWHENHEAQKNIADLTKILKEQRMSHQKLIKTTDLQYQKHLVSIDKLNKKSAEDIKSTINRFQRKQIIEYRTSELRQSELREYLEMTDNNLNVLRETNLRLEQNIYNKRFKVTSQLLGQIAKYDADVGARIAILEELTDEFETDKSRKQEFEEEMARQTIIYDALVDEREQSILTLFREKLDKFVRTRAAKIIQRWWRRFFKPRKSRKKDVKKKKGKKK